MFITGIGSSGTVSGWSEGAGKGFDWGGLVKTGLGFFSSFLQAKAQKKAAARSLQEATVYAKLQADQAERERRSAERMAESQRLYALGEEIVKSRIAEEGKEREGVLAATIAASQARERESLLFVGAGLLGLIFLAR